MKSKNELSKFWNFKVRRFVHYSLILCILLIQLIIAGFFYNEFKNRKNVAFIENQLKDVQELEHLTDNSRKELLTAQSYFQKYVASNDDEYLDSYFHSVNVLTKNLDSINDVKDKNPRLKKISVQKADSAEIRNLQTLRDSSYQVSAKSNLKLREISLPQFKKYEFNFDFDKFDIKTETKSDSVKKKGLFGRLGDAISGKENVRKESTIITVEKTKQDGLAKMKRELDSIFKSMNTYYSTEIQKVRVNVTKNKDVSTNRNQLFESFNSLMVYSNNLMSVYEFAIKDSKTELENELSKLNSANDKIRMYLVFGAMILMFIVSILIMYFTRLAFIYERKLNDANKQIAENLSFKNRILGMLSHELRSPLKIIGLFINRINKKTTDESIKEYLKSISFTNNTLLMQANQILEYTRNQQVENKLIPVVFNLNNEIDSILNSIEPYIQTRNNKFVIDKNIDPNLVVYSDNTKINQIFMNILGNANKFTENGQITVVTSSESVDENIASLVTKISDTGVGISQSDLKNIFEPYYQGVLSTEVENLGAGLGLSLCKEIVELYGGKIAVESEQNEGTTVTFSINLNINK